MDTTTGKVIDRAIAALLAIWLAGWMLYLGMAMVTRGYLYLEETVLPILYLELAISVALVAFTLRRLMKANG